LTPRNGEKLTNPERIALCQANAKAAMKQAESSSEKTAMQRLRIAQEWLELANEIGGQISN